MHVPILVMSIVVVLTLVIGAFYVDRMIVKEVETLIDRMSHPKESE